MKIDSPKKGPAPEPGAVRSDELMLAVVALDQRRVDRGRKRSLGEQRVDAMNGRSVVEWFIVPARRLSRSLF